MSVAVHAAPIIPISLGWNPIDAIRPTEPGKIQVTLVQRAPEPLRGGEAIEATGLPAVDIEHSDVHAQRSAAAQLAQAMHSAQLQGAAEVRPLAVHQVADRLRTDHQSASSAITDIAREQPDAVQRDSLEQRNDVVQRESAAQRNELVHTAQLHPGLQNRSQQDTAERPTDDPHRASPYIEDGRALIVRVVGREQLVRHVRRSGVRQAGRLAAAAERRIRSPRALPWRPTREMRVAGAASAEAWRPEAAQQSPAGSAWTTVPTLPRPMTVAISAYQINTRPDIDSGEAAALGGELMGGADEAPEHDLDEIAERVARVLPLVYWDWERRGEIAGVTTVRFRLNRDGYVIGERLMRSSGDRRVDRESNAALLLASPFTYVSGWIELKLTFRG